MTDNILTYKFKYAGLTRHVDNVTWEKDSIIGFERRKSGRFSNKIKRYTIANIEQLVRIDPLEDRIGNISRP